MFLVNHIFLYIQYSELEKCAFVTVKSEVRLQVTVIVSVDTALFFREVTIATVANH